MNHNIALDIMIKNRQHEIDKLVLAAKGSKINYVDIAFNLIELDARIIKHILTLNSILLNENDVLKEFCNKKIKIQGDILK